jgi:hypothetical protein
MAAWATDSEIREEFERIAPFRTADFRVYDILMHVGAGTGDVLRDLELLKREGRE